MQIIDEFLRQLLSQNTTAKMKTIVETIQQEQDVVIRDMEHDLLMVQGVAGSGKTSIALHRAAYLMYQGLQTKLSANNILILSPNSVFEQYISDVLPDLGEDNVVSAVFDDLLHTIIKGRSVQSRNDFLETVLADSPYKEHVKKRIAFKTSARFKEALDRFLSELPEKWIAFDDVYHEGACVIDKQTLKDKISARPETPLGVRLEQLETYILEQIFGTGTKRGQNEEKERIRQQIRSFIHPDIAALYRGFFHDEAGFYRLLQEHAPSEMLKKIRSDTAELLDTGRLCYDDAIAVAYLMLKLYGTNDYSMIRQVVIDEAQDYYPLQYEIFRLLFPNAKFTILGDMKQTLAKKEDLTIYDQIQNILKKKKASLVILDKSFRCTSEILNFSLTFIDHRSQIKSFNREGECPNVFTAEHPGQFYDLIVKEVTLCREKGLHSIALICKTGRSAARLFDKLKHRLKLSLIQNESVCAPEGVFLIPVYMAKGLEFDAVLLCDADRQNYHDEDDKNLLYVACTRALHRLSLFCEKEADPLI